MIQNISRSKWLMEKSQSWGIYSYSIPVIRQIYMLSFTSHNTSEFSSKFHQCKSHFSLSSTPSFSRCSHSKGWGKKKKKDRNEMQFPIQIKHQTVKSTERKDFFILTNVIPKRPKGQKGKLNILLPSFKSFNFEKETVMVLRDPGARQ